MAALPRLCAPYYMPFNFGPVSAAILRFNIDLVIWYGTQHSCMCTIGCKLTSFPSHRQQCVFKLLFAFSFVTIETTDSQGRLHFVRKRHFCQAPRYFGDGWQGASASICCLVSAKVYTDMNHHTVRIAERAAEQRI